MKYTILAALMTALIGFAPAHAGSCGGGNHAHSPWRWRLNISIKLTSIATKSLLGPNLKPHQWPR